MSDYLENSLMAGWQFLTGDVHFMDYGGKWYRLINDVTYHIVELINLVDACGRDAQTTYAVELVEINLDTAPIEQALGCCGWTMGEVESSPYPILVPRSSQNS